jgi:UDP-N-acetylglucosamine 1-carboxyvinyltransferase
MFIINQSEKLKGTLHVSGSKNAALPIIAANYLTWNKVKLTNVPDILDVHNLTIVGDEALQNSRSKKYFDLTSEKCLKIRVSILMIPYGLLTHGTVKFIGVGGCNLGKRSLDSFDDALVQCGIRITQKGTIKTYSQHTTPQKDIIQKEFSVTTTEALLTYLAFLPGTFAQPFTIHNAAIEPHVLNVVAFLQSLGADIAINYDHSIVIRPKKMKVHSKEFAIIGDMLEAGLYLAIGAVTPGSELTITGLDIKELLSTFTFARAVWIDYTILDHQSFRVSAKNLKKYHNTHIKTMIFPWFPTDLQSVMAVVLTQSQWVGKIFERLFEGRFAYLAELEKLGATCEILNPHQAVIIGPTKLKGNFVNSTDIRGGWALLVAGIIAAGKTIIHNESIILRGYSDIVKKLQSIGVKIEQKKD